LERGEKEDKISRSVEGQKAKKKKEFIFVFYIAGLGHFSLKGNRLNIILCGYNSIHLFSCFGGED
jgi:hypothetical protein